MSLTAKAKQSHGKSNGCPAKAGRDRMQVRVGGRCCAWKVLRCFATDLYWRDGVESGGHWGWRLAALIGRALSHYRVTAAIGAGGMGEVYRATDTKLGREVALKVLPAGMELDPARLGRFQREARAIAALNHPHIVTIFSVEEAEGVHFLTMELVEGQSLGRLIPSGGMPVARLVEIGAELADALGAAHAKGIVHRDLKPANVMLTSDGLAKELRAENSDD